MKKITVLLVVFINSMLFSQQSTFVGGYMPYYESMTGNRLEHYNYLYYAFVAASIDGNVELLGDPTKFTQFLSVTSTTTAKRMISVCTQGFAQMAVSAVARKNFAKNLRLFCVSNNLNGIDIDWEGVSNNTDKANFGAMMSDLRLELNGSGLEFSITVSFGEYAMQWYDNAALQQADFLQIMVYDAAGTWATSPNGNHSSMEHFLQAETYWVGRGFARNKLVMGLPFYGYRFNKGQGGLAEGIHYKDILARFPNALPSDNLLSDSSGDYWFNGVDLIKQKINYAKFNGFRGVFVWEIGQDNLNHPLSLDKALSEVGNSTTDTDSPTAFTVTVGALTYSSIDLLLKAYDNSGVVAFNISFDGQTKIISGVSGVEKLYRITGLTANTNYTFVVTANDVAGNVAANSPISLPVTTPVNTNTECAGTSFEAAQGSFLTGYNYSFSTVGTDVIATFELLDIRTDVKGYAWTYNPNFAEVAMTGNGKIFTKTFTGQTIGATFKVGCKFSYAGGMAVTKTFSHTVGKICSGTGFEKTIVSTPFFYPNPVQNILHLTLTDENNRLVITDLSGKRVFDNNVPSNYKLNMSTFDTGVYFLRVENARGVLNGKVIKK